MQEGSLPLIFLPLNSPLSPLPPSFLERLPEGRGCPSLSDDSPDPNISPFFYYSPRATLPGWPTGPIPSFFTCPCSPSFFFTTSFFSRPSSCPPGAFLAASDSKSSPKAIAQMPFFYPGNARSRGPFCKKGAACNTLFSDDTIWLPPLEPAITPFALRPRPRRLG